MTRDTYWSDPLRGAACLPDSTLSSLLFADVSAFCFITSHMCFLKCIHTIIESVSSHKTLFFFAVLECGLPAEVEHAELNFVNGTRGFQVHFSIFVFRSASVDEA